MLHPACGWCDDGSSTGLGTCMDGGKRGPVEWSTSLNDSLTCSSNLWYFTDCPGKSIYLAILFIILIFIQII